MRFRAQAKNDKDQEFTFWFDNSNWNGIEDRARRELKNLVDNLPGVKENGPWSFHSIDVSEL